MSIVFIYNDSGFGYKLYVGLRHANFRREKSGTGHKR